MRIFKNASIHLTVLAFILAACVAGVVEEVPVTLKYTPSNRAVMRVPSNLKTVAIGDFVDGRSNRPSASVGERIHFNRQIDRFRPKGGTPKSVADIVRGYYTHRKVGVTGSGWNGDVNTIRSQKGDMVIAGRIIELWFTSTDSATMASASSVLRLEMKIGSPRSGTIVTKTIEIKPVVRRNIFWESKDVEEWLSKTISEALDRILPSVQNRLVG